MFVRQDRSLLRLQELVDVVLECGEGERPGQEFDGFDLRTVCLGIPEEEGWGACHPDGLALLETVVDLCGVCAAVKTGLERWHIEPQCLRMLPQRLRLQLLLMGEQASVHLLAFPLVVGTPKRLRGFAGQLMDCL
jgi:hypothetical protein